MGNHDGKRKTVIGDGGAFEKPDVMSRITIVISTIMVIVLFYLGIRAYLG